MFRNTILFFPGLPILALAGVTLVLFSGCEDVIELDLPDGEPQLVVDGWLTDQPGEKVVRLRYSANYFSDAPTPAATGALVWLHDALGPVDTLREEPLGSGDYKTGYVGRAGQTYTLYIRLPNGESYASMPQVLKEVPKIDSIYARFKEETPVQDEGYYVSIDTKEPAGVGDFYRWRLYINGEYQNDPFDILVASDEFVDGNPIIDFEVATKPAQLGDTVRIEQMTISREAFDFLTQVQIQTAFVGSLFDTPPAPIPSNIKNLTDPSTEALGFFGVSGLTAAELVIAD